MGGDRGMVVFGVGMLAAAVVPFGGCQRPGELGVSDFSVTPTAETTSDGGRHFAAGLTYRESRCAASAVNFLSAPKGTEWWSFTAGGKPVGTAGGAQRAEGDGSLPLPPPGTRVVWRHKASPFTLGDHCAVTERTTEDTVSAAPPPILGNAVNAPPVPAPPPPAAPPPPTATTGTTTTPPPPAPVGPVARFSYSPSAPTPETTVTFDASASTDDAGTITSWTWRFMVDPNGIPADPPTASGQVVTSTLYSGIYTVELTVADDKGHTATTTQTIDTDPAAHRSARAAQDSTAPTPVRPLYVLAAPARVRAGVPVGLFVADAADAPPARRYGWDLDGNGRADVRTTGPGLTHIFTRPGRHVVNLRVTRRNGSSQTTRAVFQVGRRPRVGLGHTARRTVSVTLTSHALADAATLARRRVVRDTGRLVVRPLDGRQGASDALLGPLVRATTRSRIVADTRRRTARATYLVSSTLTHGRICLTTSTPLAGQSGPPVVTLRTLGATGALRGVSLSGRLRLRAGHASAVLDGPVTVGRARAHALPRACRALQHHR